MNLYDILRFVLFIPSPKITKDGAIQIAIEAFAKNGIDYNRPTVTDNLKYWTVYARDDIIPIQTVSIHQQTGEVLGFGNPPR